VKCKVNADTEKNADLSF